MVSKATALEILVGSIIITSCLPTSAPTPPTPIVEKATPNPTPGNLTFPTDVPTARPTPEVPLPTPIPRIQPGSGGEYPAGLLDSSGNPLRETEIDQQKVIEAAIAAHPELFAADPSGNPYLKWIYFPKDTNGDHQLQAEESVKVAVVTLTGSGYPDGTFFDFPEGQPVQIAPERNGNVVTWDWQLNNGAGGFGAFDAKGVLVSYVDVKTNQWVDLAVAPNYAEMKIVQGEPGTISSLDGAMGMALEGGALKIDPEGAKKAYDEVLRALVIFPPNKGYWESLLGGDVSVDALKQYLASHGGVIPTENNTYRLSFVGTSKFYGSVQRKGIPADVKNINLDRLSLLVFTPEQYSNGLDKVMVANLTPLAVSERIGGAWKTFGFYRNNFGDLVLVVGSKVTLPGMRPEFVEGEIIGGPDGKPRSTDAGIVNKTLDVFLWAMEGTSTLIWGRGGLTNAEIYPFLEELPEGLTMVQSPDKLDRVNVVAPK